MQPRRDSISMFDNPVLIGAIVVLLLVFGIYVSYNANRGLPFVPTYRVKVNVPDAEKLNPGDAVKVAGARIGQVLTETAMPGNPAYAQLELALGVKEQLPVNSIFEIRPLSILGDKYLAVTRGNSHKLMPAGGLFPISQVKVGVELDTAIDTFNPQTRAAIQLTLAGAGDAFAGRGLDINQILSAAAQLLPPGENVAKLFASSKTNVPGFIDALDNFTRTLSPVSGPLAQFFINGAATWTALAEANAAWGQTLDQLPTTEADGAAALKVASPVLRQAATIARDFEPGARLLPSASARFAALLAAGTPVFKETPSVAAPINNLNTALGNVLPPKSEALSDDFNEFDATVNSLGQTLEVLNPSQEVCNVMGVLLRNIASALSSGDATGSLVSAVALLGQPAPTSSPSQGLHYNAYPNESSSGCDAGNESYSGGTLVGEPSNASSVGTNVDQTPTPASITALAQQAGLLSTPPGARP